MNNRRSWKLSYDNKIYNLKFVLLCFSYDKILFVVLNEKVAFWTIFSVIRSTQCPESSINLMNFIKYWTKVFSKHAHTCFYKFISFRQSQVWDARCTNIRTSHFKAPNDGYQMASSQSVLQNIPNMLKMKVIDETEINVSKFLARKFTWNNLPHYCISEKKIK